MAKVSICALPQQHKVLPFVDIRLFFTPCLPRKHRLDECHAIVNSERSAVWLPRRNVRLTVVFQHIENVVQLNRKGECRCWRSRSAITLLVESTHRKSLVEDGSLMRLFCQDFCGHPPPININDQRWMLTVNAKQKTHVARVDQSLAYFARGSMRTFAGSENELLPRGCACVPILTPHDT